MNPVVLYFSRTGNTKRLAEAIAETAEAKLFNIISAESSIVETYDMLIIGTPVEGSRPAKETTEYINRLPQAQGKKTIVFSTYRIFGNERTMKIMEKQLKGKGYETVLKVSKKMKKPGDPVDFSDVVAKVKTVL